MLQKLLLTTTLCTFLSSPAIAGSLDATLADPVVTPPPAASSPDWTGFYVGGQLGFATIDANPGLSGDDIIGGFIGGYDWDLGTWVVGVGADFDFSDVRVGATNIENIWRLKLRGGYKLGNGLAYGTAGYAHADTDIAGDDGGYFVGVGYEHLVTERLSLGAEALYHKFENFGRTTVDLEATTVQLRGTYRF